MRKRQILTTVAGFAKFLRDSTQGGGEPRRSPLLGRKKKKRKRGGEEKKKEKLSYVSPGLRNVRVQGRQQEDELRKKDCMVMIDEKKRGGEDLLEKGKKNPGKPSSGMIYP